MFIYSFLLGGLGAWLAIKLTGCLGLSDTPNHRSSHTNVIPTGGGMGVLAAFLLASGVLAIPMGVWLPALVIALAGLWGGDKHRLSVKERLIIQFGCSVVFLAFCLYSKQVTPGTYLFIVPISIFIVGTSNFYNFMDGIDGIAGITSVVGFSLLYFYHPCSGIDDGYSALCLVLVFSCLGFLCFNLPRAKVFLGDIGSVFLGFVFACLVILLSENMTDFIVMTGFLTPFYLDELLTIVVRIKNRDSLIIPHRKHIYQLLANELGISHWKISLLYGVVQLIIGLSLIVLKPKGMYVILSAYLVYSLVFCLISIIIHKKVSMK